MRHSYFNQYKFKSAEWDSVELIHEMTISWQSQIAFLKHEQRFLQELLAENTITILAQNYFGKIRHLATSLTALSEQRTVMEKRLIVHRNEIELLTDNKPEFIKEKAFQDAHLLLDLGMDNYLEKYQKLKEEIFLTMQDVFKKSKQKHYLK